MARRLLFLLALTVPLAASALLAGCGDDDEVDRIGADRSGGEVLVETGERFEIELESNPTTGFQWRMADSGPPPGVELISVHFEEPDSDLVGAPGVEVFGFEAVGEGAGVLRLEYVRPFDDPVIPERIVEYIIRVDGVPFTRPTDDPPTTATAVAPDGAVIPVADLFDGTGPRDGTFSGSVLWDTASARLCEALAESFPPQCGGLAVVIANPEGIEVDLQEAQGIRWTDGPAELTGRFDGDRLILDNEAAAVEPTEADRVLIATFLAFAAGDDAAASDLPIVDELALGLGDRIIRTLEAGGWTDRAGWQLDVEEYQGFAGPFSTLDVATDPVLITVGAHNRCAGPPVPPPEGFEDRRRLSIQPEGATSCIEWWSVDFFLADDGTVEAVTLELFGP